MADRFPAGPPSGGTPAPQDLPEPDPPEDMVVFEKSIRRTQRDDLGRRKPRDNS